jgi:hypothetical protein
MVSGAVMFAASLIAARWALDFRIPLRPIIAIGVAAGIMAIVVAAAPVADDIFGLATRIALGALIYAAAIIAALPLDRGRMFAAANRPARLL